MTDMNKILRKIALLALFYILLSIAPGYCVIGPTLMLDHQERHEKEFTFGIGPSVRYKHNESSALDFEGDMAMYGIKIVGGPMNDPQFGLHYCAGEQSSEAVKYTLNMTGLSMENSFKKDPRFRWRVTCGVGNFNLKSKASGHSYKKGSFGYLEPMFLGILPFNRNIILEVGVGYTFADATGVRVEGIAVEGELLFGKF
jgi:hypothetical protein